MGIMQKSSLYKFTHPHTHTHTHIYTHSKTEKDIEELEDQCESLCWGLHDGTLCRPGVSRRWVEPQRSTVIGNFFLVVVVAVVFFCLFFVFLDDNDTLSLVRERKYSCRRGAEPETASSPRYLHTEYI